VIRTFAGARYAIDYRAHREDTRYGLKIETNKRRRQEDEARIANAAVNWIRSADVDA